MELSVVLNFVKNVDLTLNLLLILAPLVSLIIKYRVQSQSTPIHLKKFVKTVKGEFVMIFLSISVFASSQSLKILESYQSKNEIKSITADIVVHIKGNWPVGNPPFKNEPVINRVQDMFFLDFDRTYKNKHEVSRFFGAEGWYYFSSVNENTQEFRVKVLLKAEDPLIGRQISELKKVNFVYLMIPILQHKVVDADFKITKIDIKFLINKETIAEYFIEPNPAPSAVWLGNEHTIDLQINNFSREIKLIQKN